VANFLEELQLAAVGLWALYSFQPSWPDHW
jgi:hypothetical protein